MNRTCKNIVAILLAIWLPLFSGSALATSIAMQKMSGDCETMAAQMTKSHSGHTSAAHHQAPSTTGKVMIGEQQGQHNPSCNEHGVCHFACIGYLVSIVLNEEKIQLSAAIYPVTATQFQSYISALLDPPPLARV